MLARRFQLASMAARSMVSMPPASTSAERAEAATGCKIGSRIVMGYYDGPCMCRPAVAPILKFAAFCRAPASELHNHEGTGNTMILVWNLSSKHQTPDYVQPNHDHLRRFVLKNDPAPGLLARNRQNE